MNFVARRQKLAVSLSAEVVELLDRHANGRSRSRCVEEELLRALRAREWDRLMSQSTPADAEEEAEWAAYSLGVADTELRRDERPRNRAVRKRRAS